MSIRQKLVDVTAKKLLLSVMTVGVIAGGAYVATAGSAPKQKPNPFGHIVAIRAKAKHDVNAKIQAIAALRGHKLGRAPDPGQLVTGILNSQQSPYAGHGRFDVRNAWQGLQGNVVISVYVGARHDDPTQGFVIEDRHTWPGYGFVSSQEYDTSTKAGELNIASAQGDVLTLTAANGAHFRFNIATGDLVAG